MGDERTSRPNHIVWAHGVENLPSICGALHVFQAGDKHFQLAFTALTQRQDVVLVVGVAYHAGDIPGPVEEKRRHVEGHFAMAAEQKDLHGELRI